jgi:hypothetical protein
MVTLAQGDQTRAHQGGCFSKALPSVGLQFMLQDLAFVTFSVTGLTAPLV